MPNTEKDFHFPDDNFDGLELPETLEDAIGMIRALRNVLDFYSDAEPEELIADAGLRAQLVLRAKNQEEHTELFRRAVRQRTGPRPPAETWHERFTRPRFHNDQS